jgi:hypothetical protein
MRHDDLHPTLVLATFRVRDLLAEADRRRRAGAAVRRGGPRPSPAAAVRRAVGAAVIATGERLLGAGPDRPAGRLARRAARG